MQTGSHGTLIGWKSQKQVGGSTLACPITRYMYVFCGEEEPVHFHFYKITWKGGGGVKIKKEMFYLTKTCQTPFTHRFLVVFTL
jgi:hypothetical protein